MDYGMIIISILVGLLGVYYMHKRKVSFFERSGIPYVSPLPILGNMGPVLFRQMPYIDLLNSFYYKHKSAKYCGFFQFSTPIIFITDIDLAKTVLVKSFDHFTDHTGYINPKRDPFFCSSLGFRSGSEWKMRRSLITPVFSAGKLKYMHEMTMKCAGKFGDNLIEFYADTPKDVFLKDVVGKCITDIIATCQYGLELDSMRDPTNSFYVLGKRNVNFEGHLSRKFFFASNFDKICEIFDITIVEKKAREFYTDLIKDAMAFRRENNITRPDFLQLMMTLENGEDGKSIRTEEMGSLAFSFFFGAYDATAARIQFGLYEIANRPDVQKKLHEEIDEVMRRTGGNPGYEDVQSLEYLTAFINENMRYHGLTSIDRVCTKTFELPPALPGGKPVVIHPGQPIWIPVNAIHKDADYYENVDEFIPERFIGEAKNSIRSGTFMPFGYGPRSCIGVRFALFMQKILLFQILSRLEVSLSPRMITPLRHAKMCFVRIPVGGFWLRLTTRDVWKNRSF